VNRRAVITGAGQGIGREIALAMARAGWDLVLAARDVKKLEAVAAACTEIGSTANVVPTDVTDERSVADLGEAVGELGSVSALINNSGIAGPTAVSWETSSSDWDETFAVNVRGVFLTTKALLPSMIGSGGGSVTVIGSISGKRPLWGRTPYAASKMALVGYVRTLALEAGAFGIRANLVSPGFVAGPRIDAVIEQQASGRGLSTDLVRTEFEAQSPLSRLTEASEVAAACVYLSSDQASGITGTDLNVNAGVVMY
jgi:NAD(P)-dependent dehydrogenase (short-subunit alcohol dehydrogenase family)